MSDGGSTVVAVVERVPVVRFRCSCCRKTWASVTRANAHVAEGCWRLPSTRACQTCEHDYRGEAPGWDEPGVAAGCAVGARDEGETCRRDCPQWVEAPPF